jgi:hypothetical protein
VTDWLGFRAAAAGDVAGCAARDGDVALVDVGVASEGQLDAIVVKQLLRLPVLPRGVVQVKDRETW